MSYGPTPAVLSAQMEPPPILPVASMDFTIAEYEIYQNPVELSELVYWSSGDEIVEPGKGVLLHDQEIWGAGDWPDKWPPTLRGAQGLIDVFNETIEQYGGFTIVFEVDITSQWMYQDFPLLYINNYDMFDWANTPDAWADVVEMIYASNTTVMGEGYDDAGSGISTNDYYGGTPNSDAGRRFRTAGTFGFPLNSGSRRGAHSINGTPVTGYDDYVSFGSSIWDGPNDMSFVLPIQQLHFCGVGVDTFATTDWNDHWWWWWPGICYWRKFELYRPRPSFILPTLSRLPPVMSRFTQAYAEIIHQLPRNSGIFVPPSYVNVEVTDPIVNPGRVFLPSPINVDVKALPPQYDEHLSSVVLLATFNGADGETTAVDESDSAHTLTLENGAQIDTANNYTGGSSLYLPEGGVPRVLVPDSPDWPGNGLADEQFTIELFVYLTHDSPNTTQETQRLISRIGSSGTRSFSLGIIGSFEQYRGVPEFYWYPDGVSGVRLIPPDYGVKLDRHRWHHLAIGRSAAGKIRMRLDGVMIASATENTVFADITGVPLYISGGSSQPVIDGWIDDVRITAGVDRYDTDADVEVPVISYAPSNS